MSQSAPPPASPGTTGPAPAGRPERPGRYQRSVGGMVGAMLVLLAVVAVFVVLRDLNRADLTTTVPTVDYRAVAGAAEPMAEFPLLVPDRLPDGWRATSATFTPGAAQHWHLGVLTDRQRYVGLEQAAEPVDDMVREFVDPEAEPRGTVEVRGVPWQAFSDDGGDQALARRSGGVTTLVMGRVPVEQLVDFLGLLR